MNRTISIVVFCMLWFHQASFSQKPVLQVQASGGYTIPMEPINEAGHFGENGWNAQGGFSIFFGKYGIMTRGAYQRLSALPGFENFVFNQYLEVYKGSTGQYWTNSFGMIGPAFTWSLGRFDLDLYALIGMAKLTVPDLLFTKNFFGQEAEIARYYGKNDELIPFWSAGFTLHTPLYKGLSLILEPSFVSNRYLSSTLTTFRFVNAQDINNNGYIDDVEFSEAEIKKTIEDVVFSNVNLNIGLSYRFGQERVAKEPVSMIPVDSEEETIPVNPLPATQDTTDDTTASIASVEVISAPENQNRVDSIKINPASPISSENTGQNGAQNFDQAEANFLYKAGELYYQNNDFENAVACFNKLKNNEEQSMAKYMFSLSLCEMLNCDEAAKEYADFEKKYKAGDSGVLYTVFKSQYEKCRKNLAEQEALVARWEAENISKNLETQTSDEAKSDSKEASAAKDVEGTLADENKSVEKGITYRVQFVALRISNKNFPRLENIGKITHEFFPKKSMYRYTLGPYTNEDEAVSDMLKVRVMGFEDAFIAEYKDGHRTNTLYHAQ